jgi:cobyrinic acid a,c-diamide synthase
MDSIRSVVRQLEEDYIDGKPPHVVEGAMSVFHILTQEEYDKKSVRVIQEILRTQHIVIVGAQQSRVKFDANGLRTLTRLNEPVSIQGVSLVFHLAGL